MGQMMTAQIGELPQHLRDLTSVPDADDIFCDALQFHLASLNDKQSLLERIRLVLRRVEAFEAILAPHANTVFAKQACPAP